MICFDCNETENFKSNTASFFNENSEFISEFKEEMFFCHRLCKKCKNFTYVGLKKKLW